MTAPAHSPYTVEVGHHVEVRVTEIEETGVIRAAFEFEGDDFGMELDPGDLSIDESFEYAVDAMVTRVCRLVWHELLGVPVFSFDDERFTGRVDVQRPWEKEPRMPTEGWIANMPETVAAIEHEEIVEAAGGAATVTTLHDEGGHVVDMWIDPAATDSSAAVALDMTVDEMEQLARGTMPDSVMGRVIANMPTDRLLAAVAKYVDDEDPNDFEGGRLQAARALRELERRLA